MNINEMHAVLVTEVGRPDLSDQLKTYLKNAILSIHRKLNFAQDLTEKYLEFPTLAATQRTTLPEDFRQVYAIGLKCKLSQSQFFPASLSNPSDHLFTNHQPLKLPNYYVSGDTLTLLGGKNLPKFDSMYVAYFKKPDVSSDENSTWLTELDPDMFIRYAAYRLHSRVGNKAKANETYSAFTESFDLLMQSVPIL